MKRGKGYLYKLTNPPLSPTAKQGVSGENKQHVNALLVP